MKEPARISVITALPRYIEEYRDLIDKISGLKCPLLLVSYEKFIQFPEESAERIAAFAGITMTPALRAKALKTVKNGPENYLQSSRLRYVGHVDRIVGGKLRGWAMIADQPKIKAHVHLRVDGKIVKSAIANKMRKDLVDAGIGDGQHGFEVDLGNSVSSGSTLDVIAGNADFLLPNSG